MFVTGQEYLQLPRHNTPWIIEDLLPSGGSLNIFGRPKAGKSLAALQMASCISDAKVPDFLGFPIHTHGTVCYIQLDTPREVWTMDVENGQTDLQLDFANVAFTDKELVRQTLGKPFNVLDPQVVATVAESIASVQPVAVFIDTLRKVHDCDEDKSGPMKIVYEHLQEAVPNTALVIISHSRKGPTDGREDDLMAANRGSNYIAGEVDCIMRVAKKEWTYEGRTISEHKLKLLRTPKGFWQIDADAHRQAAIKAISEQGTRSLNQLATDLAESTGMHKEAARSLLRRLKSA